MNGGGESAWQDKRTGLLISFIDNKKIISWREFTGKICNYAVIHVIITKAVL